MENAAKALIMAAGVLIGVIIITIAVYLFTNLGNTSSEIYSDVEQKKIDKFNNQFLKYDGLTNCTAHDIVSIANLARNNNDYYELGEGNTNNYYVRVQVINYLYQNDNTRTENFEKLGDNYYTNFIEENSAIKINETSKNEEWKIKYFECVNVEISDTTGRVYNIIFKRSRVATDY